MTDTHRVMYLCTNPNGSEVWRCPTCGMVAIVPAVPGEQIRILKPGQNVPHSGFTERENGATHVRRAGIDLAAERGNLDINMFDPRLDVFREWMERQDL